ncbi:MAG: hypothetical protein WDZ88_01885 [Candidatus Paceibacterota bacterium]
MDTSGTNDRIGVSGDDIVTRVEKKEVEKNKNTAPAIQKTEPKKTGVVRRLRTYDDDIARIMRKDKTSVTSIALKEQEKKRVTEPTPAPKPAGKQPEIETPNRAQPATVVRFNKPVPQAPKPTPPPQLAPKLTPAPKPAPQPVLKPIPKLELHKQAPKPTLPPQPTKPPVTLPPVEQPKQEVHKKLMQEEMRVTREVKKDHAHMTLIISATLLLVLVGGGILYAGYTLFTKQNSQVAVIEKKPALLQYDSEIPLELTTREGTQPISLLRGTLTETNPSKGKISYIYLTEQTTTETGSQKTHILTSPELFTLFNHNAPPSLVRTFVGEYMTGVYGSEVPEPFLLIKVDFYSQALAGTLAWETRMANDINMLFGGISTTNTYAFTNEVISNIDTRVLVDQNNNTHLVYGFPQPELLLITTSKEAFRELSERVYASNFKK